MATGLTSELHGPELLLEVLDDYLARQKAAA